MSYIGNTPTNQNFVAGSDQFNGTGSQTVFTLSRNVNTVNDIQVVVSNVPQDPFTAYSVAGNSLTFTSAPPSGTGNIYVVYRATNTQQFVPSQKSVGLSQLSASGTPSSGTFLRGDNSWTAVAVTPTAVSDQANSSTGYFSLPAGTTAQRPGSPANGMIRFNTTNAEYEVYDSGSWRALTDQTAGVYTATYLVVAGGGGGGGDRGGGGGAGGLISSTASLNSGTAYSITVGAGGAAATVGNNSVFSSFATSLGGGAGSGGSGGSGGGASPFGGAGAGTAGQGNNGGSGSNNGSTVGNSGGGGGAGAVGSNGVSNTSGAGGVGVSSSISGSAVFYAGGGGGGSDIRSGGQPGAGGNGGGGAGGTPGVAGTANTGGGGGGGQGGVPQYAGGAGGSGIVIISYAGAQRGTGGTVTSSGGNTIHTFTTSGTYTA